MSFRSNLVLILAISFIWGGVVFGSPAASLQQGPSRGPITPSRDAELEKQSYHSLEVAKFYFYKRKPDKKDKAASDRANKSILDRLQEIIDTNPNFARMDDVDFMMGEVYQRIGDMNKAVDCWTKAVKETADEKIKSEAQKRLDEAKSQTKDKNKEGVAN
jgi:hypothetical protein